MQLNFTGRNIDVTPALKTFTTEKMQRIERRDHSLTSIDLVFHLENLTHTAEATAHVNGAKIHATAEASDMYAAIDLLVDKLITQITKHKEKHSGHH
jgi:putative sigma-54 modulation protein